METELGATKRFCASLTSNRQISRTVSAVTSRKLTLDSRVMQGVELLIVQLLEIRIILVLLGSLRGAIVPGLEIDRAGMAVG